MAMLHYENRITKESIKLGIELEFTGLTRLKAAEITCRATGSDFSHVRYHGLDCYSLSNGWKIVSDSSVTADPESCELVTGIISYNDIEVIHNVIEKFQESGAYVNYTCGLHVHVSAPHMMNVAVIKKLIQHDFTRYDMIYLATRGFARWSQPQEERFVRKACKMSSFDDIEEAWYQAYADGYTGSHYNDSRYHGLNLHSLYEGKGVEFRYFNATFDWSTVKAYIELSAGFILDAVNSYKMAQYLYVDRPYNKVYDRKSQKAYSSIAEAMEHAVYVPAVVLYRYKTLWEGYLKRMQVSKESREVLLKNF